MSWVAFHDVAESERVGLLLPYQTEAIRLSRENQIFVCEKSRRTGLTYAFGYDAALTAAKPKADGGQDYFYIAYNQEMTREFIDYCARAAKAFNQAASEPCEFLFDDGSEAGAEKGIKAFRIDFPSGNSIVALSSKPRSLRGKQGVVLIDEAAFHDQFDELLKAAIALNMWGGRVVIISTHDGADNPFNALVEDIRSGKRDGIVMRLTLQDALEQGLYQRICLVSGQPWSPEAEREWEAKLRKQYGDAAEEELDVIPARGSGVYLSRAAILAAMDPTLPVVLLSCPDGFELQPEEYRRDFINEWLETEIAPWLRDFAFNRNTFFGQDFARSGDASPFIFGQHDERMRLIARLTVEMRNVPFSAQRWILSYIINRVPRFVLGFMDGRGNGSQLAEDLAMEFGHDRVVAVMASDKTYVEHMPKLKAGVEDRTFILPKDEATLEDMRMVKLVRGVPKIPDRGKVVKTDGAKGKRHGDRAIAAMHLAAAAANDPGDFEFYSQGARAVSGY